MLFYDIYIVELQADLWIEVFKGSWPNLLVGTDENLEEPQNGSSQSRNCLVHISTSTNTGNIHMRYREVDGPVRISFKPTIGGPREWLANRSKQR